MSNDGKLWPMPAANRAEIDALKRTCEGLKRIVNETANDAAAAREERDSARAEVARMQRNITAQEETVLSYKALFEAEEQENARLGECLHLIAITSSTDVERIKRYALNSLPLATRAEAPAAEGEGKHGE